MLHRLLRGLLLVGCGSISGCVNLTAPEAISGTRPEIPDAGTAGVEADAPQAARDAPSVSAADALTDVAVRGLSVDAANPDIAANPPDQNRPLQDAPANDSAISPDVNPDVNTIINLVPLVNAGPAQTKLTVAGTVLLSGSATDDGMPAPAKLTAAWSKISGPGTVTFGAAGSSMTTAGFSSPGIYVLRLTANDGALTATSDVFITVLGLDQGLAGHYRFDEGSGLSALDTSGGANHATLTAGSAFTPGRFGTALDVSGGDTDIGVVVDPADGRLDFGTGDFTLSVWIQTTQVPVLDTTYPQVVNKTEFVANGRLGYEIYSVFTGGLTFTGLKVWSAPDVVAVHAISINDGQWHHVVGRKTVNKIELFEGGVLREEKNHALGTLSAQAPLSLGGVGGESRWSDFDGKIDDLRIYNRALSNAEIKALAGASP